ncbi:hypothetical protein [Bradyrhizobium sp.]|jgi:hypothetical protein|uniref:hypothetical protein n=1 Tax=Bradyrhizobium sp. TaxID=376 RepID=UPI002E04CA10|nr:hypothetical protein [Bradyrhizobium sp.]
MFRALLRPKAVQNSSNANELLFGHRSIPGGGQVALAGLAGFLVFLGLLLTGLRAVAGVMRTGFRAILTGAATGSGDLKNTRQPGLSWDLFLIMQTVTRSTSGIASPHSRKASGVHACCCSGV